MAEQTEVGRLIKQLSTMSYAVHLKKFYLPGNAFITTVESEKCFSLIHQSIEQLIDYLIDCEPRMVLSELSGVLIATASDINGGYAAYFDYLNEQLVQVCQNYQQAIVVAQSAKNLALEGILLAQSQRFESLQNSLIKQQTTYIEGLNRPSTLPKRLNEPFDTEAILSDL